MPASGKTTNYELPIYKPLDTVSELVTFNGAMTTIDTQMKTNETAAGANKALIEGMQSDFNSLQSDVNVISQNLSSTSLSLWNAGHITQSPSTSVPRCLFVTSEKIIIGNVTANVVLENATKTVVDNFTFVNICSFPNILPVVDLGSALDTTTTVLCYGACTISGEGSVKDFPIIALVANRINNVTTLYARFYYDISTYKFFSVNWVIVTGKY